MTIPDPYTMFVKEVSVKYGIDLCTSKRGHPYKEYVRATTMRVLWLFSGISFEKLAALFGTRTQGVYYNLHTAEENTEEYNNILQIYIDTLRRFIHLNNQSHDNRNKTR